MPNSDAKETKLLTTMPPGLSAMISRAGTSKGLPPVEKWDPPHCGKLPIRIASDGSWFYMGTPIAREALVRLFASVLRLEPDGSTCLVTPVEKIEIDVDDAHFTAVELFVSGTHHDQIITLRTNVGDIVEVGSDHPLSFKEDAATRGFKPYVEVRRGLMALLARPLVMELVQYADLDASSEDELVVWSGGQRFSSRQHPAGLR